MYLSAVMTSLNPRQQEAAMAEDKRILVLAGAGSGKTKTLLEKIYYLLRGKASGSFGNSGHHLH